MWLFYITIVFALVYLVFYPGTGQAAGHSRLERPPEPMPSEVRASDERVQVRCTRSTSAMDVKQVATDSQAHAMGERLFLNHCAQCHGSDAGGAKGFPNLRDSDWLYGGDPQSDQGNHHQRPQRHHAALGAPCSAPEGVRNVANYVRSLSGLPARWPARAARQAAVRAVLRCLSRRRRQGQSGARRAEPHRQHLALRELAKPRSSKRSARAAARHLRLPACRRTRTTSTLARSTC